MSANVMLYCSHRITEEELAEVIHEAKGILTPESAARYFGGITDGRTYVWITIIPCYDGVFDWEGNPLDEDEIVLLDQAKALLGVYHSGYHSYHNHIRQSTTGRPLCPHVLSTLAVCR